MLSTLVVWNKSSIIWSEREGPRPEWHSGIGSVVSSVSGTQAVDRAAGLLLAVMEAEHPLTFGQLQESSELAKSTVSRLLSSLERHDLVAKDENGALRPGSALTRFAHSRRSTDDLIEACRPFMVTLSDATGEKINLAVLAGQEVEQISQMECTYLLGGIDWGDQRIPLHASALGKVFLAHGAELPPGRLSKATSRTITSRQDLADDLVRVRQRGWAFADSELEPGLVAIAAPIFAADGSVVAAMSISGPTLRMTREIIKAFADQLVAAAMGASSAIGFTPGPDFVERRVGAA